jgi:hypothetical protein
MGLRIPITWVVLAALGCTADAPQGLLRISAGTRVAVDTPPATTAKATPLSSTATLAKSAAELQAEGWSAIQLPPELAATLRDTSGPGLPPLASPVVERGVRALAPSTLVRPFDSLGGFADTALLVEVALLRMGRERLAERESAVVDSLRRALEPRDPDLDAVPTGPSGLLPPVGRAPVQPSTRWAPPQHNALPVVPAGFGRGGPLPAVTQQQGGQTSTFQLAPGIEGTETTSSDGSTVTSEVGMKGGNAHGNAEVSMKSTTTAGSEFESQGEVGNKQDLSTTKRGTIDGNTVQETKSFGREERLGYCPDAAGIVRGRYKHWSRESTRGTMKGVTVETRFELQGEFEFTVQVDDQARATELLVEGHATVDFYSGARGGGNSTPIIRSGRGEGRAQGVNPAEASTGSLYIRLPPAGPATKFVQGGLLEGLMDAIYAGAALARQAEQRWRNGACVEVIATPESKPLRYSQSATFQAEVRHKRDAGSSFPYPVRAMAHKWGDHPLQIHRTYGTLSPQAVATAPVAYRYTAPAKGTQAAKLWRTSWPPRDEGFLVSVSRRGIGVDAFYVPFDSLRRTYHVTYHQRVATGALIGSEVVYRAVLHELDEPDQDGNSFVGRGDYNVRVNLVALNCTLRKLEGVETRAGGGRVKANATIHPSWTGSGAEILSFAMTPLDGPTQRFFTRSFSGLERLHQQEITARGDEAPLLASNVVGGVELKSRSGDSTYVFPMGTDPCDGSITGTHAARVVRLR